MRVSFKASSQSFTAHKKGSQMRTHIDFYMVDFFVKQNITGVQKPYYARLFRPKQTRLKKVHNSSVFKSNFCSSRKTLLFLEA